MKKTLYSQLLFTDNIYLLYRYVIRVGSEVFTSDMVGIGVGWVSWDSLLILRAKNYIIYMLIIT